MSTLSDRLILLRKQNKLSQASVAKTLNVTSALISAYEKGERRPSLDNLISLADIYHTSTDYILGRSSQNNDSLYIEITDLNELQVNLIREIVDQFDKLNKFSNSLDKNK